MWTCITFNSWTIIGQIDKRAKCPLVSGLLKTSKITSGRSSQTKEVEEFFLWPRLRLSDLWSETSVVCAEFLQTWNVCLLNLTNPAKAAISSNSSLWEGFALSTLHFHLCYMSCDVAGSTILLYEWGQWAQRRELVLGGAADKINHWRFFLLPVQEAAGLGWAQSRKVVCWRHMGHEIRGGGDDKLGKACWSHWRKQLWRTLCASPEGSTLSQPHGII